MVSVNVAIKEIILDLSSAIDTNLAYTLTNSGVGVNVQFVEKKGNKIKYLVFVLETA